MSLNLDKTDLKNDVLIITNDNGSIQCIPEDGATEDEKAMFAEFREACPNGKPIETVEPQAPQPTEFELVKQ